jgi:hypothetical protein
LRLAAGLPPDADYSAHGAKCHQCVSSPRRGSSFPGAVRHHRDHFVGGDRLQFVMDGVGLGQFGAPEERPCDSEGRAWLAVKHEFATANEPPLAPFDHIDRPADQEPSVRGAPVGRNTNPGRAGHLCAGASVEPSEPHPAQAKSSISASSFV